MVLMGTDKKTITKTAIKSIGWCARFLLGSFKDMKFDHFYRP